ncbi:unnamed protein product, partial [Prorocentrum cordatum]
MAAVEAKWDVKQMESEDKAWSQRTGPEKVLFVIIQVLKVVMAVGLLYIFLISLSMMGNAFKVIGGPTAGKVFRNNAIFDNPFAGCSLGILATVLVQSSSTSTSIIITMTAAGLIDPKNAIYMIMGANIGTSVTNTIVSMSHMGDVDQYRRAFAGATVHDCFNLLTVTILLPLEYFTHMLYHIGSALVESAGIEEDQEKQEKVDFIKKLTKPVTSRLISVDKKLVTKVAQADDQETLDGLLAQSIIQNKRTLDNHMFLDTPLSDEGGAGWLLLVISLVLLSTTLILLVKLLQTIFRGRAAIWMQGLLNLEFKTVPFVADYILILFGVGITILMQSSSITTSTLTPLVGIGLIKLDKMFPFTVGANVGTTVTGMLSALAGSNVATGMTVAFAHLFFNLIGALIWFPIPAMRAVPLTMARALGSVAADLRWFPIAYIFVVFGIIPGLLLGLSLMHWAALVFVGLPILLLLIAGSCVFGMRAYHPDRLPAVLKKDFSFMPPSMKMATADGEGQSAAVEESNIGSTDIGGARQWWLAPCAYGLGWYSILVMLMAVPNAKWSDMKYASFDARDHVGIGAWSACSAMFAEEVGWAPSPLTGADLDAHLATCMADLSSACADQSDFSTVLGANTVYEESWQGARTPTKGGLADECEGLTGCGGNCTSTQACCIPLGDLCTDVGGLTAAGGLSVAGIVFSILGMAAMLAYLARGDKRDMRKVLWGTAAAFGVAWVLLLAAWTIGLSALGQETTCWVQDDQNDGIVAAKGKLGDIGNGVGYGLGYIIGGWDEASEDDAAKQSRTKMAAVEAKWDVKQMESGDKAWSQRTGPEKVLFVIIQVLKVVMAVGLLYIFLISLSMMGNAFKVIGGPTAGKVFRNNAIFDNPFAGCSLGILATVLVQSSSTSTSIIITMTAAGLIDPKNAIYMIMGANIGTSVTNTIVSMSHMGDVDQYRRAFAGATVHDCFNMLTVTILLPLEYFTHMLYHIGSALVESAGIEEDQEKQEKVDFIKKLTKPVTSRLISVDKKLVTKVAQADDQETLDGLLAQSIIQNKRTLDNHMFLDTPLSDEGAGWLLLVISLVMLSTTLILLVKLLQTIFRGRAAIWMQGLLNLEFKTVPFVADYILILFGVGITILMQSSSITTSTLTPLVGIGLIKLDKMFPFTVGANVGTTVTGMLSALAGSNVATGMTVAFAHLFFNLIGALIWFPIPAMRAVPLTMARALGSVAADLRWFPVAYIFVVFGIIPGLLLGLSLMHWAALVFVGLPILLLLIAGSCVFGMRAYHPERLPAVLKKDFSFMPPSMKMAAADGEESAAVEESNIGSTDIGGARQWWLAPCAYGLGWYSILVMLMAVPNAKWSDMKYASFDARDHVGIGAWSACSAMFAEEVGWLWLSGALHGRGLFASRSATSATDVGGLRAAGGLSVAGIVFSILGMAAMLAYLARGDKRDMRKVLWGTAAAFGVAWVLLLAAWTIGLSALGQETTCWVQDDQNDGIVAAKGKLGDIGNGVGYGLGYIIGGWVLLNPILAITALRIVADVKAGPPQKEEASEDDAAKAKWDVKQMESRDKAWSQRTGPEKVLFVIIQVLKVVMAVGLLYIFLISLSMMGNAFKVIGGPTAGKVFRNNAIFDNPFAGCSLGILATVLVQSSSTSTSIIITMTAAGLIDPKNAIYMIMGANIGTSVTNTIVSMSHMGDVDQYRRAFAGATVHDCFNLLTVTILLPLEYFTHMLYHIGSALVESAGIEEDQEKQEKVDFIKKLTKPVTSRLISVDKKLVTKVAQADDQETLDGLLAQSIIQNKRTLDNHMFLDTPLSDEGAGWLLLVISLVMLSTTLILLVKCCSRSSGGRAAIGHWMQGLLNGVQTLDKMFPFTVGANVGTTVTGMLSALAGSNVATGMTVAFAHLFFNLIGALIWFPIPAMRAVPLTMARALGSVAADLRWFPVAYIFVVFGIIPGLLLGLSLMHWAALVFVGLPILLLLIAGSCVFGMRAYHPERLPAALKKDFSFMPPSMKMATADGEGQSAAVEESNIGSTDIGGARQWWLAPCAYGLGWYSILVMLMAVPNAKWSDMKYASFDARDHVGIGAWSACSAMFAEEVAWAPSPLTGADLDAHLATCMADLSSACADQSDFSTVLGANTVYEESWQGCTDATTGDWLSECEALTGCGDLHATQCANVSAA